MPGTLNESREGNDSRLPDGLRPAIGVRKVYVVSEVRLYREGLTDCLARQGELDVVGAGSCRDALGQIASLRPEVLLLDLTADNGLTLPRRALLLVPTLRVVAVAVAEVEANVLACAEAGICGYVPQEGSVEDVVAAIMRAVNGELACPPRIAAALFSRLATLSTGPAAAPCDAGLTPREREIAALVARGLPNKEIARHLRLGPATIKNHVHNILQKLNLQRRGEIARLRLGADAWRSHDSVGRVERLPGSP
jgi:two-component system nitrate/nitrite response regulator NarL